MSNIAQVNLVSNNSFEDTVACDLVMTITNSLAPNYFLKNWESSSGGGSPDYMNICANSHSSSLYPWISTVPKSRYGFQYPRTGNAFAAMGTYIIYDPNDSAKNFVECFSIKLKDSLKINHCYYGEFYASLADVCEISINQLSMLITAQPFYNAIGNFTNTIQPQVQWDTTTYFKDTLNWVKIAGTFIAQGGEQYLTMGNFKDGVHTKKIGIVSNFISPNAGTPKNFSFVFIDDVSLYELPSHTGTQNYMLCAGDSLLLGDTVSLPIRYQWSLNGVVVDTTKSITIKNAGTYMLQTQHCTTQTQTITIVVDNGCNKTLVAEPVIPNVFTPNGDGVNDSFGFNIVGATNLKFTIYNRWGNIEHVTSSIYNLKFQWDGRTTSGIECNAGVYFYVLEYKEANGDVKKKNGYISLMR